jgi:hypothetical protein
MESIYIKIDSLINTIDSEFIKLFDCAENSSEYEYFDFFTAIDQLIELLKQYSLVKNYKDKLVEYHHTMKDLFETEVKTIFHEIIAKNDNTREITVKYTTHLIDVIELMDEVKIINIDEQEYKYLYQNKDLNELNIDSKPVRLSLYSELIDKCKMETDIISSIEHWANHKRNINDLFYQFNLDLIPGYANGYYKRFIKKLKKQVKNLSPNNNLNNGNLKGFECNLYRDNPDIIEQIYYYMANNRKYICVDLIDFKTIFAPKTSIVTSPIKWLIISQKTKRGNQTKLYFFLEKMLQRQLTNEDKRKAAKLFIDEEGEFFKPSMKKPKEDERKMYDEFETLIKTLPQKN